MVIATPIGYNPKKQRVLISVNNKVAEAIYNPETKNVTALLDAPPANANHLLASQLPQNAAMRVKVFVYDFIEDKILGAKLQEFEYNTPTLSYKVSDELLSTSPVIMGNWDKKGLVERAMKENEGNAITITSIVVKNGKSIDALIKNFEVFVSLNSTSNNNKLELTIDGKTIITVQNLKDIYKINEFYAVVDVRFSNILRTEEVYTLIAILKDLTAKIIDTKTINVKVLVDGSVSATIEKKTNSNHSIKSEICYCQLQGIVNTSCKGQGNEITEDLYEKLSSEIGVEKNIFKAVAKVESNNRESFDQIKPFQLTKILYERHKAYKAVKKKFGEQKANELMQLNSNLFNIKPGGYRGGLEEHKRLETAIILLGERNIPVKSSSWGKFQVLGEYYSYLYNSEVDLENAQNNCEIQHFAYFRTYLIDISKGIIKAMKNKEWGKIAHLYNGPDYKKYDYDTKIKNAYEEYSSNK
jgi:hypothetical protein